MGGSCGGGTVCGGGAIPLTALPLGQTHTASSQQGHHPPVKFPDKRSGDHERTKETMFKFILFTTELFPRS